MGEAGPSWSPANRAVGPHGAGDRCGPKFLSNKNLSEPVRVGSHECSTKHEWERLRQYPVPPVALERRPLQASRLAQSFLPEVPTIPHRACHAVDSSSGAGHADQLSIQQQLPVQSRVEPLASQSFAKAIATLPDREPREVAQASAGSRADSIWSGPAPNARSQCRTMSK